MSYIALNVHSQFSILDSTASIGALVEKAQSLKMGALAITDTGNLYGAVDFYKACKAAGIKPERPGRGGATAARTAGKSAGTKGTKGAKGASSAIESGRYTPKKVTPKKRPTPPPAEPKPSRFKKLIGDEE